MMTPSLMARKRKPNYRLWLFRAMERYWKGEKQVAPLEAYKRKYERINRQPNITRKVHSPEDLAYVSDYEGVMLGSYDF